MCLLAVLPPQSFMDHYTTYFGIEDVHEHLIIFCFSSVYQWITGRCSFTAVKRSFIRVPSSLRISCCHDVQVHLLQEVIWLTSPDFITTSVLVLQLAQRIQYYKHNSLHFLVPLSFINKSQMLKKEKSSTVILKSQHIWLSNIILSLHRASIFILTSGNKQSR